MNSRFIGRKMLRKLHSLWIYISKMGPLENAQYWREKGVQVGENTYIYPNVVFSRGGKDPVVIGKNCVLTGCTIIAHDASTNRALEIDYGERSMTRPVVIEDDCFIGYGSILLMGTRIGQGSIVGAGAVVGSDIPAGSIVLGNPAKVVGNVRDLIDKRKLMLQEHPEYFPHLLDNFPHASGRSG